MASEAAIISLDDAEKLVRGHMGLLFGPGLSRPGANFPALAGAIAKEFGVDSGDSYLRAAELALLAGANIDSVTQIIRATVDAASDFVHLKRVANLHWSGVLSLALDGSFEAEIRRACERRTSGITVTEISQFPSMPPFKSIPIYKLLGRLDSGDFVYSETLYIARRPSWKYPIRDFVDRVKSGPLIGLGLSGCGSMVLDVLAECLSDFRNTISTIILLHAEFDSASRGQVLSLAAGRSNVVFVKARLSDLAARLRDVEMAGPTLPLWLPRKVGDFAALAPYHDVIALVNAQLGSPIKREETTQLLDLLFSPGLARWDPFLYNLDFRRSIEARITDSLVRPLKQSSGASAYVLIGGAASGKTTIGKRVAFDLAQKGHIVMWFRKAFAPNVQTMLHEFFRILAETTERTKRYFLFIDDPIGLGSISIRSIASAAKAHGINCTFVIIARLSDWITHEREELVDGLDVLEEFAVNDEFDGLEQNALPNYLVKLKIYNDKDAAKQAITAAPSRSTRDTLGLLYWLLPKTRRSIEASVKDEYIRLGEQAGLSRVVIGAYEKTTEFLKAAYAMVAVGDHYHTPVPVEVLVSALNVSYSAWLETVGGEHAAWGLLYGEASTDGETTVYRPRNAVVTRILVDMINGGKLGHAGEVQQLLTLLRACSGTSSVYRQFCTNILVPCSKLSHLEYQDGVQLFDSALDALPFEDRTLVHQKGMWVKDAGKDPLLAKTILEQALITKVYPYTSRGEAPEHVHTSLAATILDAADAGQISYEEATPQILRHVDQALADSFFTPRAVHVQANLMLRLLTKVGERDNADTYGLVNEALVALDAALLLLRNPLRAKADRPNKDIELLEEITGKIFEKIVPIEELTASAEELFRQYQRQDGFILAGRKLYHRAREKNSGSDYNAAFQYCERVMKVIREADQQPAPDLLSVAVCIYYEWNVNRYDPNAPKRDINWSLMSSLAGTVLKSQKYRNDPLYRYICGFALAQQGLWDNADPFFAQNRKSGIPNEQLFQIRAVLLDDHGVRFRVQGTITGDPSRKYLLVDRLNKDFNLLRSERWPGINETAHAYIGFSLAGPVAVKRP